MDDLSRQVAENTQDLNNGQRRAFNVRVNGEEHSAESQAGTVNILFPVDGQLMQVSELAFKLIINDGVMSGTGNPGNPCENWNYGEKTYATYTEWLQRYPVGSQIDVDCFAGCQCFDYAAAFWRAQVNRNLLTACPDERAQGKWWAGKALGCWVSTCARTANLGTEFIAITDWNELQGGDWVVWGSYDSTYTGPGHIAMATGRPSSDTSSTLPVLQQNGDSSNPNVGSPLNVGQLRREGGSYGDFLGAFRYNDQTWLDSVPKN